MRQLSVRDKRTREQAGRKQSGAEPFYRVYEQWMLLGEMPYPEPHCRKDMRRGRLIEPMIVCRSELRCNVCHAGKTRHGLNRFPCMPALRCGLR